jgi:hypothetical protein
MRQVEEEVEQSSDDMAAALRELTGEIRTLSARVAALESRRPDGPG